MSKFLATGKNVGKWLAGFALETAVFTVAGRIFTKQVEEMDRAVTAASKNEDLKRMFKALSGGAGEASRRVKELNQIANSSRFGVDELADAELALDSFSKGALAGGKQLRQLVTIAQDGGGSITELSGAVSTLYQNLDEGKPISEATKELISFGAITPAVAKQLDLLQQNGAGMAATWAVVEQSLAKAEQRASSAAKTLSDLQNKRANVESSRDAAVGDQFLEGRKASERAATTLTAATAGASVDAVRPLAALYNGIMAAKEGVVNFIAAWKGLGPAITTVAMIFQAIFVVVVLNSAKGMLQLIGVVSMAIIRFTGISRAAALAAIGLRGLGLAMGFVTGAAGIAITALTFWGIKLLQAQQRSDDFQKSLQEQRNAARDAAGALMNQAAAIQTLKDKSQVQIATLEKLRAAEEKYAAAQIATARTQPGTTENDEASEAETRAKLEVEQIRDIYKSITQIKEDSLAPDREARDLALERYQIEKQIRQQAEDAIVSRKSVDKKPEAIQRQLQETSNKIDAAQKFQDSLKSDTAEFDPLKRALDLAKASKDPKATAAAQSNVDTFLSAPGRNKNFLLGQDIAAREAARAELDATKAQIAQNPLRSSEAKKTLAQQQAGIVARFGSLDAVSPRSVAQLEDQRRKNEIDNQINPLVQRRGDLNASLVEAQIAAKQAKEETDLAQQRAAAEREMIGLKTKGYDLAVQEAAIRKKAIDAEIAALQKRIGNPRFNDAETRNSIAGLQNEKGGIDRELTLSRAAGLRGLKGDQAEVKAQRLENGGNAELATRRREAVQIEERILELREKGLTLEEATKQAREEQHQERLNRRQRRTDTAGGEPTVASDFLPGGAGERLKRDAAANAVSAIKSIQVDSMTGIGGNSGAGPGVQSLIQQILVEVRRMARSGAPDSGGPPTKWDDNRKGPSNPY